MGGEIEKVGSGIAILGRYGVIGVMLGMLLLIGCSYFGVYKLATNHIAHAQETSIMFTSAFNENTKALTELTDAVKYLRNN